MGVAMLSLDELIEIGSDPRRSEAQLKKPWFERGFLTDVDLAPEHPSGSLLAHGTSTTLKMIREAHVIHAVAMRAQPKGWRGVWPIYQIINYSR